MSAGLLPITDIARRGWHGRKVPNSDIETPSRNLIGALMELQRHSSPRLHSLCLEYGGGWWAGEKMYENSGSFDFFGHSGNGGGE